MLKLWVKFSGITSSRSAILEGLKLGCGFDRIRREAYLIAGTDLYPNPYNTTSSKP